MYTNKLTRRSFLAGITACATQTLWAAGKHPRFVFIGTGTRGKSRSKGIYAYLWNPTSGILIPQGLAAESDSPAFLAISPDRKHLFAVNEISDYRGTKNYSGEKDGSVSAFLLDSSTGKLTFKNTVSSGGAGPCHVSVDRTGQSVFVADGAGGSLTSYRILTDGSLSDPVTNLHFPGHSINSKRQSTAYTHCTTLSHDNRFLIVNDLGLDHITTFRFNPRTAELQPAETPFYQAIPGSGPRGFAFHPRRPWAYSVNELLSTIDVLAWDAKQGILTRTQNLPTAPANFTGTNMPATVHVESTGRFLYISNRGANTIAAFTISQNDGTLTPLQQSLCGGATPRYFTLDPTEQWLLVGNQGSATVTVLRRDLHTGRISAPGTPYVLDAPMCIVCI